MNRPPSVSADTVDGLPARLPTEVMDRPPSVVPAVINEEEQVQNAETEYFGDVLPESAAIDSNPEQPLQTENAENQHVVAVDDDENGPETTEMKVASSFYYVADNGTEVGPVSMEEIVEKYTSLDITEETLVWDGNMTRAESKPLRENKRIYVNLPKPPKRRQPSPKIQPIVEEETVSTQAQSAGRVDSVDSTPPAKSGGCCV